jgi:WD40 repeat protein
MPSASPIVRRYPLSLQGRLTLLLAASSNVLVSGSDDNYLKVWDRRSLGDSGRHARPSGHLVGHTEGITYVAPKGDGRFVLSNGKDQVRPSAE